MPLTRYETDSSLTELTSSDDESEGEPLCNAVWRSKQTPACPPQPPPRPTKPIAAKAKPAPSKKPPQISSKEKVPRPLLERPRNTTYPVSALFDQMQDELIDLDPEYQRDVVWTDDRQTGLIDSLYNNHHVPPLIFSVKIMEDGDEKKVCIDGKQRLTAIRRFLLGQIPYKDRQTNRKMWAVAVSGQKHKVASLSWLRIFKGVQIACVEYERLSEERERDIFQRVQMGMALSPADRLPAANGPYADIIRGYRQRLSGIPYLAKNFSDEKNKLYHVIAKLLWLFLNGTAPRKAEPTSARLDTWLNSKENDPRKLKSLKDDTEMVIGIYCRHKQNPTLSRPLRGTMTQLEFVMIGYLIFLCRNKMDDDKLSRTIDLLRRDLQAQSKDMKFNTENFRLGLSRVRDYAAEKISKLPTTVAGSIPFSLEVNFMDVDSDDEPLEVLAKRKRKRAFSTDGEPLSQGRDTLQASQDTSRRGPWIQPTDGASTIKRRVVSSSATTVRKTSTRITATQSLPGSAVNTVSYKLELGSAIKVQPQTPSGRKITPPRPLTPDLIPLGRKPRPPKISIPSTPKLTSSQITSPHNIETSTNNKPILPGRTQVVQGVAKDDLEYLFSDTKADEVQGATARQGTPPIDVTLQKFQILRQVRERNKRTDTMNDQTTCSPTTGGDGGRPKLPHFKQVRHDSNISVDAACLVEAQWQRDFTELGASLSPPNKATAATPANADALRVPPTMVSSCVLVPAGRISSRPSSATSRSNTLSTPVATPHASPMIPQRLPTFPAK